MLRHNLGLQTILRACFLLRDMVWDRIRYVQIEEEMDAYDDEAHGLL